VRQVFFLIIAAMFIAFSLSWASAETGETSYTLPETVIFPIYSHLDEKPEITALIPFEKDCESIESIYQEVRGHKVIFSIRLRQNKNQFCTEDGIIKENVNLNIDRFQTDSTNRVDVYFREDEENLKYFGSIEIKGNRGSLVGKK
jgi:hypothetical protein